MATIRERKYADGRKAWQIQVRVKGCQPISKTISTSKRDAEAWAAKTEGELKLGILVPQQIIETRRTVGEMLDAYSNELPRMQRSRDWRKRAVVLKWWKKRIGNQLISSISPRALRDIRTGIERGENLSGNAPSPATVNRYMSILSAAR